MPKPHRLKFIQCIRRLVAPRHTMEALLCLGILSAPWSLVACSHEGEETMEEGSAMESYLFEESLEDPRFAEDNPVDESGGDEGLPTLEEEQGEEETLDDLEDIETDHDGVLDDDTSPESSAGNCGEPIELGDLATCCDLGPAKCVPNDLIPEHLLPQLNTCPEGGSCVPESVLTTMQGGGVYTPKVCTSIAGFEGRCLSICLPNVASVMGLIPQDICADDERCAPCIDPLSGEESGACTGSVESECETDPTVDSDPAGTLPSDADNETDMDTGEDEDPAPAAQWSCDNPPEEPVLDVSELSACAEDAHCLPSASIPAEFHDMLGACEDENSLCVPDTMSQYGGFFVPPTCESISGTEGRCLSLAIPQVAAEVDYLPVSSCQPSERCSPCCDPFTGEETGACSQACDEGPMEEVCGEPIFPSCCNGLGHCIDPDLVPDEKKENIKNCTGEEAGLMCVPDAMKNPDYAGEPCQGDSLLMGAYDGVCLPDCLKLFLQISYDASPCPAYHKCVPCSGPFGGSTGAPGCE